MQNDLTRSFETTHADNIRKADDILIYCKTSKRQYPGLADEVAELKVHQNQ
jgi:hypothetical protein